MNISKLFKNWFFAKAMASLGEVDKSALSIYFDFKKKHCLYSVTRKQYKDCKLYSLSVEEQRVVCNKIKQDKDALDKWLRDRFKTRRFLSKYMQYRYENSFRLIRKRQKAYTRFFGLGQNCSVQYGVSIISEHRRTGVFKVGSDCLFARNCDIDITGDLIVGNGVSFAEGCKVLTHNHDFFGTYDDSELIPDTKRARNTPLTIGDNVLIGAHALIMPEVTEIGENAIISAGSVVTKPVPANCVVSGNPAQVISKIPPRARLIFRYDKNNKK